MNYEDLRDVLHPIEQSLDHIARALEVVSADISERKANERAANLATLQHLEREAERANNMFAACENAYERYSPGMTIPDHIHENSRHAEQAAVAADSALDAFRAAHPGLAVPS